jgi:dihydrofolate reductase
MKKLILIAAIGKNRELGYNNNLIWHFKADLANFKDTTMNHYILMGKNTYNSLPKKLLGRKYLILSSSLPESREYMLFRSMDEFLRFYDTLDEDVYVIGGASLYSSIINIADEMILTEINANFPKADVYFPIFSKMNYNCEILGKYEENEINYEIVRYSKKN